VKPVLSVPRAAAATLAGLLFCFLVAQVAFAGPTFPPLTGRVVDDANALPPDIREQLDGKLESLEQRTSRQLVVVTLPSLQGYDIADYGYQLGRTWGIGQKSSNNGVLFIIVPSERKVRIEVGYGLEPILTDALSEVILDQRVLPKFRDGDIPGGILAGTDAIIEQLTLDAPAAKARVAQAEQERSAPHVNPILVLLAFFFVISIMGRIFRGTRRSGMMWALPFLFMGGGGGRGGFGGGYGGGGFGGGGFSGGGGSFGGGGASGSW
jgi:uncharacterized protein